MMTVRNEPNNKAARGASSSKTFKSNNASEKKRKKIEKSKNNLQKKHQDSSIQSPSRDNESLGCNQVTPTSGRTKKHLRIENNENKSEGGFSMGIGDNNGSKKKGTSQSRLLWMKIVNKKAQQI